MALDFHTMEPLPPEKLEVELPVDPIKTPPAEKLDVFDKAEAAATEPPPALTDFEYRMQHGTDAKNPTPAAPVEAKEPVKADAAPAPEPEAKPRKPIKKAKGYENLPVTAETLERAVTSAATAGATAAVEAMGEKLKATTPTAPTLELDEEETERMRVFEHMGRLNAQDADMKSRAEKYLAAVVAWQEKHPDESFDGEAQYAIDLKRKHNFQWDPKRFAVAEEDLKTAPIKAQMQSMQQKLEQLEREKEAQLLAPKIQAAATSVANAVAEQLDPKLKGLFNKHGELDTAKFEAFEEEQPEVAEIYRATVESTQNFAASVHRAFNNQANSAELKNVADFCVRLEGALVGLSREDLAESLKILSPQKRKEIEGKDLVPRQKYMAMTPEQRKDAFALDADVVTPFAAQTNLEIAQSQATIERARIERILSKKGARQNPTSDTASADTASASFNLRPGAPAPIPVSRQSSKPIAVTSVSAAPLTNPEKVNSGGGFWDRLNHGSYAGK